MGLFKTGRCYREFCQLRVSSDSSLPDISVVVSPLSSLKLKSGITQIMNQTFVTFGFSRNTGISTMQNQPVMGVQYELFGHSFQQCFFHRQCIPSRRDTGTVGYPEYVGVHGNGGFPKSRIQYYAGGFSANSRQRFEFFPGAGHLTVMPVNQLLAGLDDILCLDIEQADSPDIFFQSCYAEFMNSNRGYWPLYRACR